MPTKHRITAGLLPGVGFCLLAMFSLATLAAAFVLPADGSNVVGEVRVVTASGSDTLLDIARKYDLGYNEITSANPGIDPWLPEDGAQVILPTRFVLPDVPREGLVLNVAQMRLFYYAPASKNAAASVVTHPIGIGRKNWDTPSGKTRIASKQRHPAWFPPASVRKEHALDQDLLPAMVPPGPDNPLGDYALRLALPGYLIHGTNRPWGVGMRVSHGCIRLYPEDIKTLFAQVPVGTSVTIVNHAFALGWVENQPYLQAFRQGSDAEFSMPDIDPTTFTAALSAKLGDRQEVDWEKASAIIKQGQGIPLPISPGSLTLDEMIMSAPVAD